MVILGIDPGLRYTGYGILKKEASKAYLLDYGVLKLNPTHSLQERVANFHAFIEGKIIAHSVTTIALETPFLGKNAQNFLKLGYLRGIVYLLTHTYQAQLCEFSPRQVKQAITGWGGAEKDQVARMVIQFFPAIKEQSLRHDITDALAVTLCGLWSQSTSSALCK
ncbi:MAG: crossover junction endodeoxyribonuclease RuvC [Candidatus Babeliales bacterium]